MSRESELDKIFNEYKSSYNFDNFNEKSSSSEFEKFAQMLKINLEDYSIIFLDIYFIFSDSFLINEMQYDIVKLLTDIDSTEATKEILELCKINTN